MKADWGLLGGAAAAMLALPLLVLAWSGTPLGTGLPGGTTSDPTPQQSNILPGTDREEPQEPSADALSVLPSFRILDETTGQVAEIPAADYVAGAIAAEMPASYEEDALIAQGMAAYTNDHYLAALRRADPPEELIGADTLKDGQVVFREGPVCACARLGGFGVLDEVNMAKNEALAVLHATLDHRRVIDVPGYERIQLDDAARFIGTMNYGYAGTRELNEALVSRFVVVDMPVISDENLQKLLRRSFPTLKREWAEQLTALFRDLRTKCDSGEISTKALDLRGLLAALHLIEKGIPSGQALDLGIINKAFEPFERQLVADAVWARLPRDATRDKLFD